MVAAEKTIHVEPGSELDTLLAEANGRSLVLVREGVPYRVRLEAERDESEKPDPRTNYDPERVMEGLWAAAGSISEEEAETRIADMYRWREGAGVRFRSAEVSDSTNPWLGYDAERVRVALRESAGALANIDIKALKEDLRIQRGQESKGRPD